MTDDRTASSWEPPGPGHWELETVHTRGAVPKVFEELFPAAMRDGFRAFTAPYGLPLDHIDIRFVHGHCYGRAVPVGAPPPKAGKASSAPPPIVFKALARIHPALRARARAARAALAGKRWVADRERWLGELKPARLDANRRLQAIEPGALDEDELAAHLAACIANAATGAAEHFSLIGGYNVPVGDFLVAAEEWGIGVGEALALLAGHSPASNGAAEHLAIVAEAVRQAGVATVPDLDAVAAASPAAAAALSAYLAEFGTRLVTDYTPAGSLLSELPDVVARTIEVARAGSPLDEAPVDPQPLLQRVPVADRGAFEALLAEARAAYNLRDDNVSLTFMWPMGLLRRALLACGERLTARGALRERDHVMRLGQTEITALLTGGDGPSAEEVAARVALIAAAETAGAPPTLGFSEGDPPDPSLLPKAMARVTRAMLLVFDHEMPQLSFGAGASAAFRGVGIGMAPYRGRARVAATAEEALARLEPGEVLVTTLTTPAYNAVLPIAGAVVTEQGGLLGHTALVARELGMAAVVGVAGVTGRIPDGAEVEVDPVAGTVTVLQ